MKKLFVLLAVLLIAGMSEAKVLTQSNGCRVFGMSIVADREIPGSGGAKVYQDYLELTFEALYDDKIVGVFSHIEELGAAEADAKGLANAYNKVKSNEAAIIQLIQTIKDEYTN